MFRLLDNVNELRETRVAPVKLCGFRGCIGLRTPAGLCQINSRLIVDSFERVQGSSVVWDVSMSARA